MKRKAPDTKEANTKEAKKRTPMVSVSSKNQTSGPNLRATTIRASKKSQNATVIASKDDPTIINPGSSVAESVSNVTTGAFPLFLDGNVLIRLISDSHSDLRLHQDVLMRSSTWFSNELAVFGRLPRFCFALQQMSGCEAPLLVQLKSAPGNNRPTTVSQVEACSQRDLQAVHSSPPKLPTTSTPSLKVCPPSTTLPVDLKASVRSSDIPTLKQGITVKQESEVCQQDNLVSAGTIDPVDTNDPAHALHPSQPSREEGIQLVNRRAIYDAYVEAHRSLFAMFYSSDPKISAIDIDEALNHCEKIIVLAKHYGSLPIVRPYLSCALAQFRRTMYSAIAKDPPRWLNISVALQDGLIYSEAVVHCAGCFSHYTWTTPYSSLPPSVLAIVEAKHEWLMTLRSNIDIDLFVNTLIAENRRIVSLKDGPESWIVVQIFRDWLAKQVRKQRDTKTLHHGTIYRLISRGGDAYLPVEAVTELVSNAELEGKGVCDFDELAEDLEMMKKYSKQSVEQLVKDNLTVGAESLGIPYLTCVEVGPEDYPWKEGLLEQS